MMNRTHRLLLFTLLAVALPGVCVPLTVSAANLLDVDAARLISRADLHYARPPGRIEEGLPVGNGRMGTLLWVTTSTLRMQINRVDVFGCGGATNSFPERHTDTCGGCGFVDIGFEGAGAGVFAGGRAPQHLSCYDGVAAIEGEGVKTRTLAWNTQDVLATRIDARPATSAVRVKLRMLRAPVIKSLEHTATSKLEIRDGVLILIQRFEEGDYYCASAVAVGLGEGSAKARMAGEREAELLVESGGRPLTVLTASAASFKQNVDVAAAALARFQAARAAGWDGLYASNKEWWADFWSRSFVHLHSADGVADRVEAEYNYYLYVMASCSRGDFPAKFNGMLWTNDGDHRAWGAQYWGANQECLYNSALFAANHGELMEPMFKMYTGMLDSLARAARQQWGSQGIYIPETGAFDGLAALPEDIAQEMRDLYLLRKPWSQASPQFLEYTRLRPGHASRWNWKMGGKWAGGEWQTVERGSGPYGPTSHIFSRGAKVAYQFWLRYEYTGDLGWLRERAWPVLKGVAEFYRNYPNLKKEKDGLFHIYYVNSNEPLWGGRDTDEEIAAMRALLPVALKASELLGVDAELRPAWRELLEHLPPLPASDMPATTDTMTLKRYPTIGLPPSSSRSRRAPQGGQRPALPARRAAGGPTWIKGLPPIVQGRGGSLPDGNTTPMWFLDLANLESDPATQRLAKATYDAYFPGGVSERSHPGVLSKLAGVAALMGRAEDVRLLIPAQLGVTEGPALANRMTIKEGAGTTCNEQAGRAADALHMALCQSVPAAPAQAPVIRVFPAWPGAWDADFSLLCRGGFRVTSSIRQGRIGFVEIESQRGGPCRLRNPWGEGTGVALFRNGGSAEKLKGALLVFETRQGEDLVLTPSGENPPAKHAAVFD